MIGDVLKVGNGKDYKHLAEGDIPVFGTGGYMISVNDFLYEGDSVFIGRKGTINKPFFYSGKFWTVDTLFYTHSFNKVIPHFVYGLFQRVNWNNYNEASGVPSLSKSTIEKIPIAIPSIEEQQKISSLLSLLDQRIETQKKIIEKYESLIRGLYHSVFNQPASTLQLKDVVSVVKGQQVNGEELLEYGKYYVMNGGTEPSGYLDVCNTPANIISISEGGNSCGYVQYNTEPFWSGGHCYSLIQKEQSVNYQYLYHFMKYKERNIMALRIGSGLPNVQKKDLERFEIRVLPTKQQNRVAEILEDVSAKCDLERRILQGWQCQKSYLLHNLFI